MADKLSRLIETESELDEMLERTKREAARLLEAAREEAAERLRQFELELDGANARLRARLEAEKEGVISEIEQNAAQEVQILDRLGDEDVAELADYVIRRLVGADSRGTS
jgi:vacuolar-type H+-ATPase subunit H